MISTALLAVASASIGAQSPAERAERMSRALVRAGNGADTSARYGIDEEMARLHVTGASIAVVAGGRVVWARGFGVKEFGGSARVDSTTLFLAGSISKPVFATGVLALVDRGKLPLDSGVNSLLKSWRLPDSRFTEKEQVTLRRILSHQAGLTVWGFPGYDAAMPIPSVPQLLDGTPPANTRAVRNDTTPGARWLYSGGGYTIAQLAVTDAMGESFPALMQRLVLAPAGMTRSTYENPLPAARAGEAASGHEKPDTVVRGKWHVYPEMAAAGLWTTASDLARWGTAVMKSYRGEKDAFLSTAVAREMLRPQTALPRTGPGAAPAGVWWGLGVQLAGSARTFNFSHGGRDEGFVASAVFYPEPDVGLVVMTNATNGTFLGEVRMAFNQAFVGR
jgi:CubicO group peptidase (beta-lactamase class C family)